MSLRPLILLWFRGVDMRLKDNYVLAKAVAMVRERAGSPNVVPLLCIDPRSMCPSRTSAYRAKFVLESAEDLRASLRAISSDLVVRYARPDEAVSELLASIEHSGEPVVLTQEEVTSEELSVDKEVRSVLAPRNGHLLTIWNSTMLHIDDVPFRRNMQDLPDMFTPFRHKVENKVGIRKPSAEVPVIPTNIEGTVCGDIPSLTTLGYEEGAEQVPHDAYVFAGGESAALERLHAYIAEQHARTYFETRNGLMGDNYSTRLSPWLAHGCISARTIWWAVEEHERKHGANKSTYWIKFELLFRDFFRFVGIKYGTRLFMLNGPAGVHRDWNRSEALLRKWKEGTTGCSIVDAFMREMAATGWMSNRGRQIVASYLVYDLQLDWRKGADHFERLLIDYDVTQNWGNWTSAAGVLSASARRNRFNPAKQAADHDPSGKFVRRWVPSSGQDGQQTLVTSFFKQPPRNKDRSKRRKRVQHFDY